METCSICNALVLDLFSHQHLQHDHLRLKRCVTCDFYLFTIPQVNFHRRQNHILQDNPYYSWRELMKVDQPKTFHCNLCPQSFSKLRLLQVHAARHGPKEVLSRKYGMHPK